MHQVQIVNTLYCDTRTQCVNTIQLNKYVRIAVLTATIIASDQDVNSSICSLNFEAFASEFEEQHEETSQHENVEPKRRQKKHESLFMSQSKIFVHSP